jgi:DNA-directed RNA polymerase specialized sigma24 family protein
MRPPSIQDPDLKRDALSRAIEREMSSLMAGIRILVARSGLATSAAEIESLAEDTLQDVVLKVMEHRNAYDEGRPMRPWFMKFVVNHLKNLRGSRKRRGGIVTPVAEAGRVQAALAATGVGADEVSEAEMFDLLAGGNGSHPPGDVGWSTLLSLASEGDREILTLRFRDGLDCAEIGQALAITAGAARTRLCRALERLRQAYRQSEQAARGES